MILLDANKLRGKIAAAGLTQHELAERIGISENTLSASMTGRRPFTIPEVEAMCQELGITKGSEKAAIFLA